MSEFGNIGSLGLSAESRVYLIQVKVERAKKHIRDLEVAALPWKGKDTYVLRTDRDSQTGQEVNNGFVRLGELPFDVLTIAGDALQNLRSALDHLAFHLAIVANIATPKQLRRMYFPIFENRQAYESELSRKVELMRPDAQEAIKLVEAYGGGRGDILWRLHMINNWDKHCGLAAPAHDVLFYAEHFYGGFWFKASHPHFSGIYGPEHGQNVEFAAGPAFGEVEPGHPEPLIPSLHEMANFIDALVRSFEPFLF